uniref:non-specific serine/threonine protein kinase n=1 Tax=Phlebotomus papatasi TaxID=29031 RepID=A0A1B0DH56_PHLPP
MHENNLIHGDLTTSNMLMVPREDGQKELVMIDFGLSKGNNNNEAKGVDLYVLERALLSTHSGAPKLFSAIMRAYKEENRKNSESAVAKYEEVRARGRKRTMVIKQGAEGKLYIGEYKGEKCLVKERFQKKYRHPELDAQLTKERIRAEVKAIGKCAGLGIRTPKVFGHDLNDRKIYMEYFEEAETAKDYINRLISSEDRASSGTT